MRANKNSSNLQFDWTWSTYDEIESKVELFGPAARTNAGAHITWSCTYPAYFSLNTDELIINEEIFTDQLSGHGDIRRDFSLSIHNDLHSTTAFNQQVFVEQYFENFNLNL